MPKVQGDPEDLRLAVIFLRSLRHWDKGRLAAESGVSRNMISAYELGGVPPTRRTLERLATAVGFPVALLDPLLSLIHAGRIAWERGPLTAEGVAALAREAGLAAEGWLEIVRSAMLLLLARLRSPREPADPAEARRRARDAWSRLAILPAEQRLLAVPFARDLQTWAGVEVICAESESRAAASAAEALGLAELALAFADRVRASARPQTQGYAWAFLGNARRVGNALREAREALTQAARLWGDGGDRAACPLDGSRLLDLEASLLKDERRLGESLELLDRAAGMPGLTPIRRARLLIKRANALRVMGDFESALTALLEAKPAIENSQEPRLLWVLRFGTAVNLIHLGRAEEADALLPDARALAAEIGNDLDRLRQRWLEGKVAAGLGRTGEAIETLSQVLADFAALGMDYDAALAMSELAALYLEAGRTAEVAALTRRSAAIFHAKGVHPEAQKALHTFRQAVEQETVTAALVRRLLDFLYRAQHDPRLRFDG